MREIKFRAWINKLECWADTVAVISIAGNSGNVGIKEQIVFHNIEIEQYTGLKDKNGREIYDGDIVVANWHWTEPTIFVFPDDIYTVTEYCLDEEEIEVVGNIHENPELLK